MMQHLPSIAPCECRNMDVALPLSNCRGQVMAWHRHGLQKERVAKEDRWSNEERVPTIDYNVLYTHIWVLRGRFTWAFRSHVRPFRYTNTTQKVSNHDVFKILCRVPFIMLRRALMYHIFWNPPSRWFHPTIRVLYVVLSLTVPPRWGSLTPRPTRNDPHFCVKTDMYTFSRIHEISI